MGGGLFLGEGKKSVQGNSNNYVLEQKTKNIGQTQEKEWGGVNRGLVDASKKARELKRDKRGSHKEKEEPRSRSTIHKQIRCVCKKPVK